MARRVRHAFREMPKDVRDALAETQGMTSTRSLNKLRKSGVKPIVSLKKLRGMARRASFLSGTPVKVTKDMTGGHRYADGIAIRRNDKVEVRVHPVLKYYDRRYVADLIGHELDHARVDKRSIRRQKARAKKGGKKHGYF